METIITKERYSPSEREIARMLHDATRYKLEDQEYRKKVLANNKLEYLLYKFRKAVRDRKIAFKQATAEKKRIEDNIQETIQWFHTSQTVWYQFDDDEIVQHVDILNAALKTADNAQTSARTSISEENRKRRSPSESSAAEKILAGKTIANFLLNLTGIDLSFIVNLLG